MIVGILAPFSDPGAIARAIDDLLSDENRRQTMRKNAYRIGRKMVWSNVAQMYVRSFERARRKQCESRSQSQKACKKDVFAFALSRHRTACRLIES